MTDGTNLQGQPEEAWLKALRQQLKGLRYGVIQIVVQDSTVVQIDKTEKIRLPSRES